MLNDSLNPGAVVVRGPRSLRAGLLLSAFLLAGCAGECADDENIRWESDALFVRATDEGFDNLFVSYQDDDEYIRTVAMVFRNGEWTVRLRLKQRRRIALALITASGQRILSPVGRQVEIDGEPFGLYQPCG